MLIAPIWILAYTHPVAAKLVMITAFILLFLALVSFGINAKPFESLAATAAYVLPQSSLYTCVRGSTDDENRYSAILMVFFAAWR